MDVGIINRKTDNNNISDEGAIHFKKLINLTVLDIGKDVSISDNNSIGTEGLVHISSILSLTTLDLCIMCITQIIIMLGIQELNTFQSSATCQP